MGILDAPGISPAGLDSRLTAYTTSARSAVLAAAANLAGRPSIDTMPPTVYVDNGQDLNGGPVANTRLTSVSSLSGWYTPISPLDTTKRRYFGPSAPYNNQADPFPDTWSVHFLSGGVGLYPFVDEHRMTGGQKIQYMLKQQNDAMYRIMVNGKYLTDTPVYVGGSPGSIACITVDFGAPLSSPVDIRFEGTGFRYYGQRYEAATTISKVPGPDPKKLLLAFDSYGGGAGTVSALSTAPRTMAWLLGYRGVINTSAGGSGYIAGGNLGQPAFKDRVSEIVATNADVIIIGLGHNDTSSTNSAIQAAANSMVSGIRSGLPNAKIIVTGPMFSSASPGVYAAMQASIFAGVSSISGVVTVDTTARPWITSDNYASYVSSDNTHPLQVGSDYLGYYLAGLIKLATADRF